MPAKESEAPGGMPETWVLQVSGAPYPRRGAMVVPSGVFPPAGNAGLCSALPGPWRTGRSTGSVQGRIHSVPGRAEHRPAHWVDSDAPGHRWRRTFLRSLGFVRACLASERPAKPAGRIPETLIMLPLEISLAILPGAALPFAGMARSHQTRFRSRAWRLAPEGGSVSVPTPAPECYFLPTLAARIALASSPCSNSANNARSWLIRSCKSICGAWRIKRLLSRIARGGLPASVRA